MGVPSAIADCVRFNPSAGGTTDWTYSSAVTGYQSPTAANMVNGAQYSYRAESVDLSQWEIGTGVYNSSTGVITRANVLFNSAGTTAKINFSAAPQVALVALKEDLIARPAGHLFGLTLSTPGSYTTFSVAAGEATDSTNSDLMVLASAISKTTAGWSVGSGNGALDTGSIAPNTTYHVFQIKRPDTGVVDIALSLSAAAPALGANIPAAYSISRRIGSLITNASSQWVKFTQRGDEFLLDVGVADVNGAALVTTSGTLYPLSVPSGIQVNALFSMSATYGSGSYIYVGASSPDVTDGAITTGNVDLIGTSTNVYPVISYSIRTDTSRRVRIRGGGPGTGTVTVNTKGWIDTRGRV